MFFVLSHELIVFGFPRKKMRDVTSERFAAINVFTTHHYVNRNLTYCGWHHLRMCFLLQTAEYKLCL